MKIIAISDTHGKESSLMLPEGDVLIHSGDFSTHQPNLDTFLKWFSEQEHKYKILVAGNHDTLVALMGYEAFFKKCQKLGIIYLEDTSVEINGVLFHGSPWAPLVADMAFMRFEKNLIQYWDKIPDNVRVLITHGPAEGVCDLTYSQEHVGSFTLKKRIKELKYLKLHCFGHIHESYGLNTSNKYLSVNSSIVNYSENTLNKPVVIYYINE